METVCPRLASGMRTNPAAAAQGTSGKFFPVTMEQKLRRKSVSPALRRSSSLPYGLAQ